MYPPLHGLGLEDYDCGIISAGALLQYLLETQKNNLSHLTHITPYTTGKIYDAGQFYQEESGTMRDAEGKAKKEVPMLWVLDKTRTAMGARTTHGSMWNSL